MSFRFRRTRILALLSLLIVTIVLAEELIVSKDGIDVHAKKISMSALVVTLKTGDHVQVLERTDDGWLRVKIGDKEGYVKASRLEQPKSGGFGDLLKNSKFEARGEASDPTASNASRGLGPGATIYANQKGLSAAPLNAMIDTRRSVIGPRYEQFIREGNVGPR
jgi:uncharacterized protein YgiM (DUF1202 family)